MADPQTISGLLRQIKDQAVLVTPVVDEATPLYTDYVNGFMDDLISNAQDLPITLASPDVKINEIYDDLVKLFFMFVVSTIRGFGLGQGVDIEKQKTYGVRLLDDIHQFQVKIQGSDNKLKEFLKKLKGHLGANTDFEGEENVWGFFDKKQQPSVTGTVTRPNTAETKIQRDLIGRIKCLIKELDYKTSNDESNLAKAYKEYKTKIEQDNLYKQSSTQGEDDEAHCTNDIDIVHISNVQDSQLFEYFQKLVNFKEDLKGAVRIFVRVKPLTGGTAQNITYPNKEQALEGNKFITINGTKNYGPFYNVFPPESNNGTIFENTRSMFEQVLSGYHVAVFGYGYSGSGKTYTLLNGNEGDLGLAVEALQYFLNNKASISIVSIKELYVDQLTGLNTKPSLTGKVIDLQMNSGETLTFESFKTLIKTIEQKRKGEKRIRVTINNPESSRSHLFITLKVSNVGKEGYMTICDMGGREDPIEIFKTTRITPYGNIVSASDPNVAYDITSGKNISVSGESRGVYFDPNRCKTITELTGYEFEGFFTSIYSQLKPKSDLTEARRLLRRNITDEIKGLNEVKVLDAIKHVADTCKEGFYINETINHLVWYFKQLNGKPITLKQITKPLTIVGSYNVDSVFVAPPNIFLQETIKSTNGLPNDTIGIVSTLEKIRLQNNASGPTKFAMFACIRQEDDSKIVDFSTKTLEFAQTIASTATQGGKRPKKRASLKRRARVP
jgi:hypothetical protein